VLFRSQEHNDFILRWLKTATEIFRVAKPATPDTHMVSYFVVVDQHTNQILLVDHKTSGLWLPTGGHVELDEHPADTVRREAREELGINAEFLFEKPIFATVTKTVDPIAVHTDVSLWYVLKGCCEKPLHPDKEEFHEARWFGFNDLPYDLSDPHLRRFIKKLNLNYLNKL
jgi:8-oxo-dGTP diphosphatase